MNEIISVNGILQSRGDYSITSNNSIIFRNAPPAGSVISVMSEDYTRWDYAGDGSTHTFPLPHNDKAKFREFMNQVYIHRDNPTVKDALERLQIVMELVR